MLLQNTYLNTIIYQEIDCILKLPWGRIIYRLYVYIKISSVTNYNFISKVLFIYSVKVVWKFADWMKHRETLEMPSDRHEAGYNEVNFSPHLHRWGRHPSLIQTRPPAQEGTWPASCPLAAQSSGLHCGGRATSSGRVGGGRWLLDLSYSSTSYRRVFSNRRNAV